MVLCAITSAAKLVDVSTTESEIESVASNSLVLVEKSSIGADCVKSGVACCSLKEGGKKGVLLDDDDAPQKLREI